MRFALLTLLLTGCTTPLLVVRAPDAAGLSPADIQQIQRVVSVRPCSEYQLDGQAPGKVYVRAGSCEDNSSADAFWVIKRSGTWYIDASSPAPPATF
jgi:hypothetical protein